MLVLSRHLGQSIQVGNNITVTVLQHSPHGGIKVGIEAPKDITILREELIEEDERRLAKMKLKQDL